MQTSKRNFKKWAGNDEAQNERLLSSLAPRRALGNRNHQAGPPRHCDQGSGCGCTWGTNDKAEEGKRGSREAPLQERNLVVNMDT